MYDCLIVRVAEAKEKGRVALNENSLVSRKCIFCGVMFLAHRTDAKYHDAACRQRALRWRKRLGALAFRLDRDLSEITEYLAYPDAKPSAASILNGAQNSIKIVLQENNIKVIK